MTYTLGVDLGTSFTTAAVMRDDQPPEVVPLGGQSQQIPSVVYRTPDGRWVFGDPAERHAITEPGRVRRAFKLSIGTGTSLLIGGAPVPAPALSRALLSWVVQNVTAGEGAPPERLEVSFPASWGPYRREKMQSVIDLGDGSEASLCTEPEAAAVYFAASGRVALDQTVAVYDLGGGTFDAAILRRSADGFEVLGEPVGTDEAGGVNFDQAMSALVQAAAGLDVTDDPEELPGVVILRRDLVEAKEALSTELSVTVPLLLADRPRTVQVTRLEFEDAIRDIVAGTVRQFATAVRSAGLTSGEVDHIVLAGGSSRIPLVTELLSRELGRPLTPSPQPKLSVAMGAARLAAARQAARAPAPRRSRATPAPTPVPIPVEATLVPPRTEPIELPTATTALERAPVPAPPVGPPATARRRQPSWFRLGSLALFVVAVLLTFWGRDADPPPALTWDSNGLAASGQSWTAQDTLQPELLGNKLWPREPVRGSEQGFDLTAYRLWLAGPMPVEVIGAHPGVVLLEPGPTVPLSQRLLTIPGAFMLLAALFSFAYVESLLRGIRRRRSGVRASELLGLLGAGAVAGIALVMASWILLGTVMSSGAGVATALCGCACVGLLAFGWDSPVDTSKVG